MVCVRARILDSYAQSERARLGVPADGREAAAASSPHPIQWRRFALAKSETTLDRSYDVRPRCLAASTYKCERVLSVAYVHACT